MRRVSLLFAAALVFGALVLGIATVSPGVSAQDDIAEAGHPLVGTWILSDPASTPSLVTFTSDGTLTDLELAGGTGLGAWEATGPQTAAATLIIAISVPEFSATIQVNATFEIDTSGDAGTFAYSYTAVGADGTVFETYTDGSGTITRLPIQPLEAAGTPMPEIPTWNPNQEEGGEEEGAEATPGA
jgi:hypothetical protein